MRRYSKYLIVILILIVTIMTNSIALGEVSLEAIESIYKTFDTSSPDYDGIVKLVTRCLAMPLEEIVPVFEEAIKRLPRHADILHITLGYICASKNASEKALEEFNKVEKEPPDPLWQSAKYEGLGIAYLAEGYTFMAIKNFENAISINPNRPSPYLRLGDVYYRNLEDPQKAKYYYSEYVRLNPNAENRAEIEKIISSFK